jgi:hypothetical protein
MTKRPFSLPGEASILARAAYDALMDGETLFGIAGGWKEHLPYVERHLDALIALLRTDEPLSADLRHALANALDLNVKTPINLVPKRKRRKRLETFFRWNDKSEKLYALYIELQQAPHEMEADDALDKAAKEVGVGESNAQKMIADASERRRLDTAIKEVQARGGGPTELRALFDSFEPNGRPRGRKPKAK